MRAFAFSSSPGFDLRKDCLYGDYQIIDNKHHFPRRWSNQAGQLDDETMRTPIVGASASA